MEPNESSLDFATIALKLGYVDEQSAEQLRSQAGSESENQINVALEQGKLAKEKVAAVKDVMAPIHSLEGYRITDVLGRGGMGVVYKAIQINLDRSVAIKTILMEKVSPTTIARLEREARSLAKIQHPNIINIFDFGKQDQQFYFAMEFVDGMDAQELVQSQSRLNEKIAWGILRQVAAGLAHAWKVGIVHRDIKPANILLLPPPEGTNIPGNAPLAKIADFGLAYQGESVSTDPPSSDARFTEERVIVGSPSYMAPEQFESAVVDFKSDIYACGATAYQLISGTRPFEGLPISKLMAAKETGGLPLPIDQIECSQDSKLLIKRMMAAEPSDRFASYDELISAMDQLIDSQRNASSSEALIVQPHELTTDYVDTFQASADDPTIDHVSLNTLHTAPAASRLIPIATVVTAIVLLGLVVWLIIDRFQYKPGERTLVAGKTEYLYYGETLEGWPLTPISGSWGTENDTMSTHPIFGKNGVHSRSIGSFGLGNYRVEALVWPHPDTSAQIHFGISPADNQFGVVSVTRDQASVYFQSAEGTGQKTYLAKVPIQISDDRYAHVVIEKQPTDWFVFVDEQLVGTLPIQSSNDLTEIRLAAIDGKVWFNQLNISELVPAQSF